MTSASSARPASSVFRAIVERLSMAVFVFERSRLVYRNAAAIKLAGRLRASYEIEIEVLLHAHLASARLETETPGQPNGSGATVPPAVTLLTATHGEPFY